MPLENHHLKVVSFHVSTLANEKTTGKERDTETGLDYFGARYMSSSQGRFSSPDPYGLGARLREPQTWNMYSYTMNNPMRYVDPNGLWSTANHAAIHKASFPGLLPQHLALINRVSQRQDSILRGGQNRSASFQHAMHSPSQTAGQARQAYLKFVNERMNTANTLQFGTFLNQNGDAGLFNNALEAFAELLHAVTDDLSPAHEGFQEWNFDLLDVATHVRTENAPITPGQLQRAVEASRQVFLTTFGPDLYFQATGERAPQQKEVPKPTHKLCLQDREGNCVQ